MFFAYLSKSSPPSLCNNILLFNKKNDALKLFKADSESIIRHTQTKKFENMLPEQNEQVQ